MIEKQLSINKNSAEVYGDQIVSQIKNFIQMGKLKPGSRLPPTMKLAKHLGLGYSTVEKAISQLTAEGYLERARKKGTFVAPPCKSQKIRIFLSPSSLASYPFVEECVRKSRQTVEFVEKNEPADIIRMNQVLLRQPETTDQVIEPLDTWLKQTNKISKKDTIHSMSQRYQINSRTFALPIYVSPFMLYYNREIFRNADIEEPDSNWTWQDLMNAVVCLKSHCDRNWAGVLPFMDNFTYYLPFIFQNNGHLFAKGKSRGLLSKETIKALEFLNILRHESGGTICKHVDELISRFFNGKAAMIMHCGLVSYQLNQINPFEWGVASIPQGKRRANLLFADALSITKESANKEASWNFIEDCVSSDAQRFYIEKKFPFPNHKSLVQEYTRKHGHVYQNIINDFNYIVDEHIEHGPNVYSILFNEMDNFFARKITTKDIYKKCERTTIILESVLRNQNNNKLIEEIA